jgi:SAM-dependent methyltransferase
LGTRTATILQTYIVPLEVCAVASVLEKHIIPILMKQEKNFDINVPPEKENPLYFSYVFAESVVWLLKLYLGSLKNKRILDIACGSEEQEFTGSQIWYPAMLLLASQEGAHGTGIDLHAFEQAKGLYQHIQADLIPYLLEGLSLETLINSAAISTDHAPPFDIIVCSNFLKNTSPWLTYLLSSKSNDIVKLIEAMRSNLLQQTIHLGKEGTILNIDGDWYQILDEKVVPKE